MDTKFITGIQRETPILGKHLLLSQGDSYGHSFMQVLLKIYHFQCHNEHEDLPWGAFPTDWPLSSHNSIELHSKNG